MSRDGAEGTTAKTATVDVYGEFYHLVGGNAFALIFGVWQTRVGQVERVVDLLGGHRWIGWVDYDELIA